MVFPPATWLGDRARRRMKQSRKAERKKKEVIVGEK
jgi:hypothetical protein